ncbi:MAG: hypothetical protein IT442_11620 [Phycisphaeraceae bacterium]|nr:hypothetical protein [Phycisphaeraceae bacterium]
MQYSKSRRWVVMACAVTTAVVGFQARADVQQSHATARVITRATANPTGTQVVPLNRSGRLHVGVVVPRAASATYVINGRSDLSAPRPRLIDVRLVNITVQLDPTRDYLRQGYGLIDEQCFIPQAQSLWQSIMLNKASVVRRADVLPPLAPLPQPRAIILKPGFLMPDEPKDQGPVEPKETMNPMAMRE